MIRIRYYYAFHRDQLLVYRVIVHLRLLSSPPPPIRRRPSPSPASPSSFIPSSPSLSSLDDANDRPPRSHPSSDVAAATFECVDLYDAWFHFASPSNAAARADHVAASARASMTTWKKSNASFARTVATPPPGSLELVLAFALALPVLGVAVFWTRRANARGFAASFDIASTTSRVTTMSPPPGTTDCDFAHVAKSGRCIVKRPRNVAARDVWSYSSRIIVIAFAATPVHSVHATRHDDGDDGFGFFESRAPFRKRRTASRARRSSSLDHSALYARIFTLEMKGVSWS